MTVPVVFRLVVFRPFASEVILAKVKSSDEDGIRCTAFILLFFLVWLHRLTAKMCSVELMQFLAVSVGFFDDIYVPLIYLPEPSAL